jgi:hypothetical protein
MNCPRCQSDRLQKHGYSQGRPRRHCKDCGYRFTVKDPAQDPVLAEVANKAHKKELKHWQLQHKNALAHIQRLEHERDAALAIARTPKIHPIPTGDPSSRNDATALVVWSDWHWGERVELAATNGLNEFNPRIAEARANKIYQNTLKLINKERHSSTIGHLVIGLLGDLITGMLHEEQAELGGNHLSPTEEVEQVQNSLSSGIRFLLDKGELERITIICVGGNHGRLTRKMRSGAGHLYSLENLMYWNLRRVLQDPRIEWIIPEANMTYFKVYALTLRFFHGWEVNYQGGVGGVLVPMLKFLLRQDRNIRADYSFCGHFHTLLNNDSNGIGINGSLIGANPWSLSKGFPAEPPRQLFRVIDREHGLTGAYPILC